MSTEEILKKIDFEMSKMLGKSSNKMTNDEFRCFVTEQWEQMGQDKYDTYGINILVGRMMNEAIWTKDAKDLLKWIKEDQKVRNFHNNSIEIKYNYYANAFKDCEAFNEALAFFKEQNTKEAEYFIDYFQDLVNNPEKIQALLEEKSTEKIDNGFWIELKKWAAFFKEKDIKVSYTILKKDGEETSRHSKQHKKSIAYLKENQMEILESFLNELLKIYPSLQENYKDFYSEEEKREFMPNIYDISGFSGLLSVSEIYLFSEYDDDFAYYGIGFHCQWELEHGLGVVMHKNRVVKIGDFTDAFDIHIPMKLKS